MTTEPGSTAHPPLYDPGDRWVPVDRRFLGLDRVTLLPALVVAVFVVVMAAVLPLLDRVVSYDDRVVEGDVMALAGGVTFVPAVGWGVTAGVRAGDVPASGRYPMSATVEDGDASLTVRTGEFTGDAAALLRQIRETSQALDDSVRIDTTPTPFTTDSGDVGLISRYAGPQSSGVVAAFVSDGLGVQVVAAGPPDVERARSGELSRMIASVRFGGEGAR